MGKSTQQQSVALRPAPLLLPRRLPTIIQILIAVSAMMNVLQSLSFHQSLASALPLALARTSLLILTPILIEAVALRPAPLLLPRRLPTIIQILIAFSAMMIVLQSVMHQQVFNTSRRQAQRRTVLYPKSLSGSIHMYDTVPEYAKRVFKDRPKLPNRVILFEQFGKATAIARFKSTYPSYRVTKLKKREFKLFKHPELFDTTFNGNISLHHINKNAYFKASSEFIYIVSALYRAKNMKHPSHNKTVTVLSKPKNDGGVRKSATVVDHQEVVFTGWIQEQLSNSSVLCCFLRDNSSVISFDNMKRLIWTQVKKQELLASKVFCPIPPDVGRKHVIGAALSLPQDRCRKESFMSIEHTTLRQEGSIGLCAKILYGDMPADRLLEWIEIQKHIEVDKVLLYVYNLDASTVEVVKHYTQEGFVQMIPFDYPLASELERYVGEKEAMAYIDEQVVVFDCMERLRGFTYAAIMDVDEILYAKSMKYHGLKALMNKLFTQYPLAAGFTFKTEIFVTDWPTKDQSDAHLFWHMRHQNRTRPMIDRPKNVVKLDRVVMGSIWTHNFTTKPGFKRYLVPAHMAVIKHYRPCRENWGCNQRQGYIDKSIVRIISNIKDKIYDKFTQLRIRQTT